MRLLHRFQHDQITVSDDDADRLRRTTDDSTVLTVTPPHPDDIPVSLAPTLRGIREHATGLFGLGNRSPIYSFEIRRPAPDTLRFQISLPAQRLVRKFRAHLTGQMPHVQVTEDGTNGLPVEPGDSIGGGLVTVARRDWFPIRTDFGYPPINALVGQLHPHILPQTKFVVQVLFKPVAGQPVRQWYWRKRALQEMAYLRNEKEHMVGAHRMTPLEGEQADTLQRTARPPVYWCSIRLVVIGAGELTMDRVQELAGAFAMYEADVTGQSLHVDPVTPVRREHLLRFLQAVVDREYRGWSRKFRATTDELGVLVGVPSRDVPNVDRAQR